MMSTATFIACSPECERRTDSRPLLDSKNVILKKGRLLQRKTLKIWLIYHYTYKVLNCLPYERDTHDRARQLSERKVVVFANSLLSNEAYLQFIHNIQLFLVIDFGKNKMRRYFRRRHIWCGSGGHIGSHFSFSASIRWRVVTKVRIA